MPAEAPGRPDPVRPTPPDSRSPNGHEAQRVRPGEYVPSEPEYDRTRLAVRRARRHTTCRNGRTQYDRRPLNETLANGSPVGRPSRARTPTAPTPTDRRRTGLRRRLPCRLPRRVASRRGLRERGVRAVPATSRSEPHGPGWRASGYGRPTTGGCSVRLGLRRRARPRARRHAVGACPDRHSRGSHPSSALAADGSDDWTAAAARRSVPEPPVEPDPVRDPVGPPDPQQACAPRGGGPSPGAHSAERPRYAGHAHRTRPPTTPVGRRAGTGRPTRGTPRSGTTSCGPVDRATAPQARSLSPHRGGRRDRTGRRAAPCVSSRVRGICAARDLGRSVMSVVTTAASRAYPGDVATSTRRRLAPASRERHGQHGRRRVPPDASRS